VDPERITLIAVGEHPGIARFGGLGELDAAQLRVVAAQAAMALSADALALATRAWDALRAPDPRGIAELTEVRSVELRFLAEAFGRLAREYPSSAPAKAPPSTSACRCTKPRSSRRHVSNRCLAGGRGRGAPLHEPDRQAAQEDRPVP
jgi:hypothetical protein